MCCRFHMVRKWYESALGSLVAISPSTYTEFKLTVTGREGRLRNTIAKISFVISLVVTVAKRVLRRLSKRNRCRNVHRRLLDRLKIRFLLQMTLFFLWIEWISWRLRREGFRNMPPCQPRFYPRLRESRLLVAEVAITSIITGYCTQDSNEN